MRRWIPLLFLLTLFLPSCSPDRPIDLPAVVSAMAGEDAAAGEVWFWERLDGAGDENAIHAMPDSLISAAFGDGEVPDEFALLEGYAVRLSGFARAEEYGCFVVLRERDAEAVAAMCLRRMDAVARLCGEETVCVPPLIIGRCIFYAIGEGSEEAISRARALMGA